ncbi:MAG TPA: phosphopyruvate hydratase [bacterium]|nr:MAG: Enolase [Parcubacteria group bacterium ADurb.Bin115]HNU81675.1 phosphopyruvate hydratase [bacterium]HOD86825.1 phosphopyruvate hydratase [bacterium]HPW05407.1 phosphopyruvate hydratase [bacterium]
MKIKSISALEILDSRGNPTISAKVTLEDGSVGEAAVPSGASTGSYEAVELRDGDINRYQGAGVLTAVKNVEEIIAPALIGFEADNQVGLDEKMIALDGTTNKAKLGANAILSVSLACARAAAVSSGQPLYQYLSKFNPEFNGQYILPVPMMNVLNGGKHANWATDIQEYMILPVGAKNVAGAIRMGAEIYQSLKKILKNKGYAISVGDEGGFAPAFKDNEEPFQVLTEAVVATGYSLGEEVVFGIDAAATEFYTDGVYSLKKEGKKLSAQELIFFYQELSARYPLVSFEDVLAEDDWDGFRAFTEMFAPLCQIVGDDLYVTNVKRLERGIAEKSSNSILIKLNQIGTLTETVAAINLARKNGLTTVVSHRSGETEDAFIADFVVAMGMGQIKTGAPCRSERTAKYNRLLAIAAELGDKAVYAFFPFAGK